MKPNQLLRWQKKYSKQPSMCRARFVYLIPSLLIFGSFEQFLLCVSPARTVSLYQLSEGFKSAFGSLTTDPSSLTKGLASWWGSLDPPSQPKRNEMQERVQASSKVTSWLRQRDCFCLCDTTASVTTFYLAIIQPMKSKFPIAPHGVFMCTVPLP